MTDLQESACARLCLLTKAAWTNEEPPLLSRATVNRMVASRVLEGLVLREDASFPEDRMQQARALLSRASAVRACLTAYEQDGYRVLLPEDGDWPVALRKLGLHAPQFLFMKGEEALLTKRKLAVAGSRAIQREMRICAAHVGKMIAQAGCVLVTGGARGVDECAAKGAIEAGGSVILIPARAQGELLRESWITQAMSAGNLLLLYDSLPDDPFSAARALVRNHAIYALGEAALVVASQEGMGGSYRGAMDCLRGGWTPVYVCDGEHKDMDGNRALLREGARRFSAQRPLEQQLYTEVQTEMWME